MLGENGAGKSTLMKIIYGAVQADAGEMLWEGQPVAIAQPGACRARSASAWCSSISRCSRRSPCVENIALALSDAPSTCRRLSRRSARCRSATACRSIPARLVHDLSVGERQRVEIVRCLLQDPQLLIMDEPTSVLTPQAVRKLFETLRRLAAEGCSILYISHKLDEIQALCHTATVLRDGRVTGTAIRAEETTASSWRGMMVGARPAGLHRQPAGARAAKPRARGRRRCRVPADDPFGVDLDDISLRRARRRDRRHRRRLGQRPGGTAVALLAASARRARPTRSRIGGTAAGRLRRRARRGSASPSCPRSGSAAARCRRCRWPRTRC